MSIPPAPLFKKTRAFRGAAWPGRCGGCRTRKLCRIRGFGSTVGGQNGRQDAATAAAWQRSLNLSLIRVESNFRAGNWPFQLRHLIRGLCTVYRTGLDLPGNLLRQVRFSFLDDGHEEQGLAVALFFP